MHTIIGITVQAQNKDEAVLEAESFFRTNLLDQYGIDYGGVEQAGSYDFPEFNAINKEPAELMKQNENGQYVGRDFADLLVETTENHFKANIEAIRDSLSNKSNDDLWNGGEVMDRYHMYEAGSYGGGAIRLYDADWGGGVRSQWDYDHVKKEWEKPCQVPYWIVPMDIHF